MIRNKKPKSRFEFNFDAKKVRLVSKNIAIVMVWCVIILFLVRCQMLKSKGNPLWIEQQVMGIKDFVMDKLNPNQAQEIKSIQPNLKKN
jgi:hypothetical protein